MIGCRSNRNVEIPDAPPPYANFPAPLNFQNPQPIPQNSSGNLFAASYNPNQPISNNSNSENEASVFIFQAGMFSVRKPIFGHLFKTPKELN